MDRNHTKTGLINWVVLLLAGIVSVFVTRYVNSISGWMGSVVIGAGFLVAVVFGFLVYRRFDERLAGLYIVERGSH